MAEEGILRKWWGKMLFGIVLIIFGLVTFLWPGITLNIFILLFGLAMLVLGAIILIYGLSARWLQRHRWLHVLEGVLYIVIGLIALLLPDATAVAIAYLFAIWAIILGLMEIFVGGFVPKEIAETFGKYAKLLTILSGGLSLIIGILILLFPGAGILAFLWLVAAYAIIIGVLNLAGGIAGKA